MRSRCFIDLRIELLNLIAPSLHLVKRVSLAKPSTPIGIQDSFGTSVLRRQQRRNPHSQVAIQQID